jgi:hypothetical protein
MSLPHTRLVVGIWTAAIVAAACIVTSTSASAQKAPGDTGGGVQVVDSTGRIVGLLVDTVEPSQTSNVVAVKVGSVELSLSLSRVGFQRGSSYGQDSLLYYSYSSSDCSGPAMMSAVYPLRETIVIGTTAIYAADPVKRVTTNSAQPVNPDGSLGLCFAYSRTDYFGRPATFDLSAFTAPFEVASNNGGGPRASAPQVIDRTHHIIGPLVDFNFVALTVGGVRVSVPINRIGLFPQREDFYGPGIVAYTSSDCSGPALMSAPGPLRRGFASGGTVMYPADPIRLVTINSLHAIDEPDLCQSGFNTTDYFGPLATFELSAFTPPFDVQ